MRWAPALLLAAAPLLAAPAPRYRFEPGLEIVYESAYRTEGEGIAGEGRAALRAWVVRANDDGSFRLVVHHVLEVWGNPYEHVAVVDVFRDGRYVDHPSLAGRFKPTGLFPYLPGAKGPWSGTDHDGEVRSYERLPGEGFRFRETTDGPLNRVFAITQESEVTFDEARGLVSHVKYRSKQGRGFESTDTGETRLVSVEKRDPLWVERLEKDVLRYHEARDRADAHLKAVGDDPEALAKAKGAFEAFVGVVSVDWLRAHAEEEAKGLDEIAQWKEEEAREQVRFLGQPGAAFRLKDLAGREHALEDYRGKVVLLDFWYRECGFCVQAMPQVKEVAAHFRERPVAVLGLNTDRKREDARLVAETMELTYPTLLKAGGLVEKYGVRGFPTIVILDKQGRVRAYHVGWSPALRRDVGAEVEKLLLE